MGMSDRGCRTCGGSGWTTVGRAKNGKPIKDRCPGDTSAATAGSGDLPAGAAFREMPEKETGDIDEMVMRMREHLAEQEALLPDLDQMEQDLVAPLRPKVGRLPQGPVPAETIFNPEEPDYESIEEMEENAAGYIQFVKDNPEDGAWQIENGEAEDYKFQRVGNGFLYSMRMGDHPEEDLRHPSELPPVDRALALSKDAHRGQKDKLGVPYYLHPRGVADYLDSIPEYKALTRMEKEDAKTAAYLHDVLEDTNYTRADLEALGFSKGALDVVEAVTAPKGMPKDEYYEKVKAAGRVAVAVKLADLGHNNLQARRAQLPGAPGNPVPPGGEDQYTRLGKKYVKAYRAFGAQVPDHLLPFAD